MFALAFLLSGCRNRSACDHELEAIDSMMARQDHREALRRLEQFPAAEVGKDDKAYYGLLLTMAKYKNYCEFDDDSLITGIVEYYRKERKQELYLRSLIAQGCVNEDLGRLDKAVECYHQAEIIESVQDTADIAYAKLRLGTIYHKSHIGTQTIALQKYEEALSLYQAIGDKHYELLCLTEVGALYRNLNEKHDSAVLYLKAACELAKTDKDPFFIFTTNFLLSEYYLVREKDYKTAVQYGRRALSVKPSVVEHPRAHYRIAESYLNLGQKDSASYYLKTAPRMVETADSIVYYDVMSKLEHARHDEGLSKHYMELAHTLADSVTVHGLNHRLLAVEKKYDLQQEELENARLQSRLLGTWLVLAAIAIGTLLSLLGLLRYRQRLHLKEHEHEMIKADLNASIAGLRQMQSRLDSYESELQSSEAACREQIAANETLEQERQRLKSAIDNLEIKKLQSDNLRAIISQQIESVKQLMTWYYQSDATTFARKFHEIMSIPARDDTDASYWANLYALVNDLQDGVLARVQDAAGGRLSNSEMNLLALYCCGFSHSAIMVTMGYKHIGTVYNKKNQIARKLGVNDLDQFIQIKA